MATPIPSAGDIITTATITSWTTVAAATGCIDKHGQQTKCGPNKGKVAGIAVGCALGALVVVGAIALLWARAVRKRKSKAAEEESVKSLAVVEEAASPPTPAPRATYISLGRGDCYTPVRFEGEESYVYHPPSNSSKATLDLGASRNSVAAHPG